jgi:hypothetical protein
MIWTKDQPKTLGYYWLRNYKFDDEEYFNAAAVIVSVTSSFGLPLEFSFCGNDGMWRLTRLEAGEWAGPILEPNEPSSQN